MTAGIINETMDRRSLSSSEAMGVVREVDSALRDLTGRDLRADLRYGVFDLESGVLFPEESV